MEDGILKNSIKTGLTVAAMTLSALALSGCQSSSESKTSASADPCGASQYKSLVGTNAKDLNMTQFPAGTRLLYPTTPMTRDYRMDRLNIHADKQGNIIRMDCN